MKVSLTPRVVDRPSSATLIGVASAAITLAGSLAQLAHGVDFGNSNPGSGELDRISGLLTVVATVPLVAWRFAPRGVFVLTASATVVVVGLGYPIGLPLGPTAALFLFASSRREIEPWTRWSTATVIGLFVAYLIGAALGQEQFPGSELFHTGLAWALAWFAGERARLRRLQIADLSERAQRAEREAAAEHRLAVAEERARIARDLHDSAGHAINVIAVRAGAARMRQDPERSRAALEAIEELARKTVGEIDQIVGSLRDRGATNDTVDAPPGLVSLSTLVERHRATGLEVSVVSKGSPRQPDSPADQAAYRILQEALTNAARHGVGAARVDLAYDSASLVLAISNPAPEASTTRSNGGHGLIGMRERAVLLGGTLEAERVNGSFVVRARLPYGASNA